MNIEEKTIKLAEVAGFTDIMLPMGFHQQMSDEKTKECGGRWRFEIPKYFEDLNAVHELEKVLTEKQQRDYVFRLLVELVDGSVTNNLNDHFIFIRATAAERCEAIGKTLGLW